MIALDRRKMDIALFLSIPIGLFMLIAPTVGLFLLVGRSPSRLYQFVAAALGAFLAFTLTFGFMYLEAPYSEKDTTAIRRRQRGLIGCWAYIIIFSLGVCWQLYRVG